MQQRRDTVLVHPGTYVENINFNGKDIAVIGSGGASHCVIDGGGNGHVVLFETNETRLAVLQGFTITNGFAYGAGIRISYASPTILECIISENEGDDSGPLSGTGGVMVNGGNPEIGLSAQVN